MTIEISGSPETPCSEAPDALQQNGVQVRDQAFDTVLITEAEVTLGTAAATGGCRKERRWVAVLSQIFALPKKSRPKRRPYPPAMAYLELSRMSREMQRL
jgi:hypothetical protein